jgi:hypothetical protein
MTEIEGKLSNLREKRTGILQTKDYSKEKGKYRREGVRLKPRKKRKGHHSMSEQRPPSPQDPEIEQEGQGF